MIITFRAAGQLLQLLMLERNKSKVVRKALVAYYRRLGLWKDDTKRTEREQNARYE